MKKLGGLTPLLLILYSLLQPQNDNFGDTDFLWGDDEIGSHDVLVARQPNFNEPFYSKAGLVERSLTWMLPIRSQTFRSSLVTMVLQNGPILTPRYPNHHNSLTDEDINLIENLWKQDIERHPSFANELYFQQSSELSISGVKVDNVSSDEGFAEILSSEDTRIVNLNPQFSVDNIEPSVNDQLTNDVIEDLSDGLVQETSDISVPEATWSSPISQNLPLDIPDPDGISNDWMSSLVSDPVLSVSVPPNNCSFNELFDVDSVINESFPFGAVGGQLSPELDSSDMKNLLFECENLFNGEDFDKKDENVQPSSSNAHINGLQNKMRCDPIILKPKESSLGTRFLQELHDDSFDSTSEESFPLKSINNNLPYMPSFREQCSSDDSSPTKSDAPDMYRDSTSYLDSNNKRPKPHISFNHSYIASSFRKSVEKGVDHNPLKRKFSLLEEYSDSSSSEDRFDSTESLLKSRRKDIDHERARELKLPFTVEEIVQLPYNEFARYISNHQLSERQLQLVRDIRRRGRNKRAAQNSRQKKLDEIAVMANRVDRYSEKKNLVLLERNSIKSQLLNSLDEYERVYMQLMNRLNLDPSTYTIEDSPSGALRITRRSTRSQSKPRSRSSSPDNSGRRS